VAPSTKDAACEEWRGQAGSVASVRAAAAAFSAVVLLYAPTAEAQQKRQEAPPEAIELYRSGRKHYEAGRYRQAVVDLKAARRLDPASPNLIYNVARVSELLGNLDEAIDYYGRYLKLLPRSEKEERERIRAALRRLEGARKYVITLAAKEKSGLKALVAPTPTQMRGKADALFWISASTGIAVLTTGAVMGVLALNRQDRVNGFVVGRDGTRDDRDRLLSEAETFAVVADVSFAVGASVLVGSMLLFFLRETDVEPNEEPKLKVVLGRHGATAVLKGAL
jgi:tetratricopeptide (TPR) repeat protein